MSERTILCPRCRHIKSTVEDSRHNARGVRRRRLCPNGHRYTTQETIEPKNIVRGPGRSGAGHVWFGESK